MCIRDRSTSHKDDAEEQMQRRAGMRRRTRRMRRRTTRTRVYGCRPSSAACAGAQRSRRLR
eukprot:539824-Amphidinium_carterae.1